MQAVGPSQDVDGLSTLHAALQAVPLLVRLHILGANKERSATLQVVREYDQASQVEVNITAGSIDYMHSWLTCFCDL